MTPDEARRIAEINFKYQGTCEPALVSKLIDLWEAAAALEIAFIATGEVSTGIWNEVAAALNALANHDPKGEPG